MRTPILFAALLAAALVVDTGPDVAARATPVTAPVTVASVAAPSPADRELALDVLELI